MEYSIPEICQIIGGGTPKTSVAEYWNGDICWLSVKDFAGDCRYVYDTEKKITQLGLNNSSTKLLQKNDIIISARGTVGEMAMIPYPMAFNQSCFGIRGNEKVDKTYLYYLLKTKIRDLKKQANGAVFDTITISTFNSIVCDIPELDIQIEIASILSSLDDKIAVNRKICENLEAQAQALFKHWFIDFAPFKDGQFVESDLGLIPEGWRVGVIGDYCVIRSGFAFKSSWWQDEGVKVVKIKNITDGGTLDMSDCSCVSKEHASLASSFQTKSGDLLIAMTGATIGKFCVVNGQETYCVNQRVGKFFLGDNPLEKLPFIYCILKRDDVYKEIVNKGQGSAQPNISGKDIEEIKIIIPPQSIIKQFNEELYSSFELRINGELENHRLSTLRDTLLPKLMSGQIKVDDLK